MGNPTTAGRVGDDLVEAIDALHIEIGCRERKLLAYIAEYDKTGRWRHHGCKDMAEWISGRLGITRWIARRWVGAAHALAALPQLAAALEAGTLCLDKVAELARFATPKTERQLIAWARRVTLRTIRARADAALRPALDDTQSATTDRYLRWWWTDDHLLYLEGMVPADHGAAIATGLARTARALPELPRAAHVNAEDGFEQRCADALYVWASGGTDATRLEPPTVVVHTTLDEVRSSVLEAGPVLHPETAKRLACDARLQFVLTDQAGNALGIGRSARNVPAWLMRALRHRDHGCTFPGCGSQAYLEAHHVRHWEHGGPTDLDNLVLTCGFHHKLVHEFKWKIRLEGSVVKWFYPSGRRYDPGPIPPKRFELTAEPDTRNWLAVAV